MNELRSRLERHIIGWRRVSTTVEGFPMTSEELRTEVERTWVEALAATRARALTDLDHLLDSDAPPDLRIKAAGLLGILGDRRSSVPRLARALLDETVRGEAMNSLSRLGGANVRRQLVPLISHPDEDVRWMAAYALKSGDAHPTAVEALLVALQDVSEDVRDNAAESLGELNPRRGRQRVRAALEGALEDQSPRVRYSAAFSLGILGDKRVLPLLDRVAADDHAPAFNETVAEEAARAAEGIRARLRLPSGSS
jgi:HEAT repeat protein